jgi:basic membrane lipoprotein Med (substrate-binding protein (PBP1-ABC) superfamily)/DNA-binding SARP family transcriptional activator
VGNGGSAWEVRVDIRILGPLEVGSNGTTADLGRPKQRALLAILALHANQIVSTDRLVELLWGDRAPKMAAHAIHVYVSQLRKALEPLGATPMIEYRSPGYVLVTDPSALDANRFDQLVRDATRLRETGDAAHAEMGLEAALRLWRGPPLADFVYDDFAQPTIRHLCERHLDALEELVAVEAALGHDEDALLTAEAAVREDPLRERAREQLMLSLYRCGRHAEALREYQQYRRLLGEELGLEPSPALRQLEERILLHDPALRPDQPPDPGRNPYKGLRPFTELDAGDYFGRERLVAELLHELTAGRRFLALVGPSGSGKSSVLHAGLIPALRAGAAPGSERWSIAALVPGTRPLEDLDRALSGAASEGPLLLVIDQLEELFTAAGERDRREFLDRLTDAAVDDRSTWTVVALRADFYDRPLLHPGFASVFTSGVINVVPMTADEIEAAIVEPARRAGVTVEPGLLAGLVADVVDRPGALPLLQYTLTDLFEQRTADELTLEAYRALGGLQVALCRRADEVFSQLDDEQGEIAMQLFVRLVRLGEGTRDARRRVPIRELTALDVDPVALSDLLERFGRNRLLSFDRSPTTGDATVELAHEALLWEWGRLARWIDRHRADLQRHGALARRVEEWEASGRAPDDLLAGRRLDEHVAWSAESDVRLTVNERAYLQAGLERQRIERARESAVAAGQRRLQRRARNRLIGLIGVVALLVAGIGLALVDPFAGPPPDIAVVLQGPLDRGVDDLIEAGFDRAVAGTGLDTERVIVSHGEYESRVRALSDDGVELVVVGWDLPGRAAFDHPETRFIALEYPGYEDLANVSTAVFAKQEGGFLMGAVAALASETATIGYVAGWDDPYLVAAEAGYVAGARWIDPDIEVLTTYLARTSSGFSSFNLGLDAARAMYRAGADVIFHQAGTSGLGVFEAAHTESEAQGRHLWAIGTDSDQYATLPLLARREGFDPQTWQSHVLTSLIHRYDIVIESMVGDYVQGRFVAGVREYGLAEGAFEVADSGGFLHDLRPVIDELRAAIIAGEIEVPSTR